MSDLIDRQAAIDALCRVDEYNGRSIEAIRQLPSAQPEPIKINIDDFDKEDLERFKKELGNTPITVLPAQPEIIRCKDCKYNATSKKCLNPNSFFLVPTDDDFCSYAERREVTT